MISIPTSIYFIMCGLSGYALGSAAVKNNLSSIFIIIICAIIVDMIVS